MFGLSQATRLSNLKSVSITMLRQLAFNPPIFRGSCVPGHALFSENFKGVMSGVSLGTWLSNLKSVTLTAFEQLAFNAQKYKGDVALGIPLYWKIFKGSCPNCLGERVSQIWSPYLQPCWSNQHLTPQNLSGHASLATPSFRKILKSHVRNIPGNMLVKFEVRNCK